MRLVATLVFIAFPLVEIALLVKTGQWLGFWPTLGIVVATGALGVVLLRRQSLAVLGRVASDLREGQPPIEALADGAMLLVAGAFLLAPGLLTDFMGLMLLLPSVRRHLREAIATHLEVSVAVFSDADRPSSGPAPKGRPRRPYSQGPVIDGEFERLDERTRDPRRGS